MEDSATYTALSAQQRTFFEAHGYVVLRGAVPPALTTDVLERASRRRDKMVAAGSWSRAGDFNFPHLGRSDTIFACVHTPRVARAMEALLGVGHVQLPPKGVVKWVGQRQRRGSSSSSTTADSGSPATDAVEADRLGSKERGVWREYWHIDGAGNGHLVDLQKRSEGITSAGLHGGLRVGKSRTGGSVLNFSLLCGVFLHDVPLPWRGNFTVWPGAHHACSTLIARDGLDAFVQGGRPSFTTLRAMAATRRNELGLSTPDPEPVQLCVRAGDVVLAHPLLPHAAGWNLDAPQRYAAYFRVRHAQHDALRPEMLAGNLWRELDVASPPGGLVGEETRAAAPLGGPAAAAAAAPPLPPAAPAS